ncbi:MAG: PilZ domain-containing protein [Deltaproteobacteria bacterium]|nr:PilZ domain-containing protein [Deltaproteobacteria bacterium]
MEERRRHERYPIIFGSDIDSDSNSARLGLTQDISQSGVLLLTLSPYGVGKRIKLRIVIEENDVTERVAKVVRETDVDNRGMWQCEVAVEFEEQLPDEVVKRLREVSKDS